MGNTLQEGRYRPLLFTTYFTTTFFCLATSASSHLSLGPQEVGHEGVATGRRDLSLLRSRFFQHRRRAYSSALRFSISQDGSFRYLFE